MPKLEDIKSYMTHEIMHELKVPGNSVKLIVSATNLHSSLLCWMANRYSDLYKMSQESI